MRCVVLPEYGDVELFRIKERDPPKPGTGQLLIQVAGAAVNPVDTKLRRGLYRDWLPLSFPATLGADFSGTVIAVGPGVSDSRVGQRVMGMVDVVRSGAYAEQMVVGAEEAIPVPHGLDLIEAAALPMGVMTGYDLVEVGLDIKHGERILVTGAAGSVGRAAVFAAAERGAEVIALVRSQPTPPISGASRTIDMADDYALTGVGHFDCVADTLGGEVARATLPMLRAGGRFCTVTVDVPDISDGRQISATSMIVSRNVSQLARFANAVASGAALLPPALRRPLEDVADVHRKVELGGTGGKFVLVP